MASRKPPTDKPKTPRPRNGAAKRSRSRSKANGSSNGKANAKANGASNGHGEDLDGLDDDTRAILDELAADSEDVAAVDAVTSAALGHAIKSGQAGARRAIEQHEPGAVAAALVLALPDEWRDDDRTYQLLEGLNDGDAAIILSWISASWSLGYACRVNDEREGNPAIVTPEMLEVA